MTAVRSVVLWLIFVWAATLTDRRLHHSITPW